MKRFLVILALICAIMTSLTAGTMAAYTTQLATVSDKVIAKKFVISVDNSRTSDLEGTEISPGDTIWYKMTITNDTNETLGISADIDVTAEIKGELANVCTIEMVRNTNGDPFKEKTAEQIRKNEKQTYDHNNGAVVDTVLAQTDGRTTKVGIQYNNVGLKTSNNQEQDVSVVAFYLKITWPYKTDAASNEADSKMVMNDDGTVRSQAAAFDLEININAVSHNVHQEIGTNGKSVNGSMDLVRGRVFSLKEA